MSIFKTGLLLSAITGLFVALGYWLGGMGGMIVAVVLASLGNMAAYWFSDKLVLKMTRAQPLTEAESPVLYRMTQRLAQRAEIPMPRLYLVPDPSPNAFATGRNPQNGVVAVNQGLLNLLDEREVEGVIAHEIAHIKHRDTLTSAVAATIAGAISAIVNIAYFAAIFMPSDDDSPNPIVLLVMSMVAPLAAMVIQMAISRTREYQADATAAWLVGSPRGLQSALAKLGHGVAAIPSQTLTPSTAHMAIVSPLSGARGLGFVAKLFSTHPPLEERIRRLNQVQLEVA